MNWRAAAGRVWKLPVIWDARPLEPEPVHVICVAVPYSGPRLPAPLAALAAADTRKVDGS